MNEQAKWKAAIEPVGPTPISEITYMQWLIGQALAASNPDNTPHANAKAAIEAAEEVIKIIEHV